MLRRDVRTAKPEHSIWRDLPEDVFRQHLVNLEERTNAVPIDPRSFLIPTRAPNSADDIPNTLPLAIEQQLADDFASIVAVEEGAQSVAACCIELGTSQQKSPPTIRFAALDISSNENIRTVLEKTCQILIQVSQVSPNGSSFTSKSDKPSIQTHTEELFTQLIHLHHQRLLARLRSSKWEKPSYLSRSHKKPLWADFPNLIHRTEFLYSRKERVLRQQVEISLTDLGAMYKSFESIPPSDEITALQHLVLSTYTFFSLSQTQDFTTRLESKTLTSTKSSREGPTSQLASAMKTLRQIQKIAGLRRICISMIETARLYPWVFENGVKIEYLQPFEPLETAIGYEEWARKCHVHAEVQLVVFYDLEERKARRRAQIQTQTQTQGEGIDDNDGSTQKKCAAFHTPRCIGTSKWLCYLCFLFLRSHGGFFVHRTHGRLYDQWTVPDLEEFDDGICERYRKVLGEMDEEVLRAAEEIEREMEVDGKGKERGKEKGEIARRRRVEPMTSMELLRWDGTDVEVDGGGRMRYAS